MSEEEGGSRENARTVASINGVKNDNATARRPVSTRIRIEGVSQVVTFRDIV
jgi:hypothetical protein